MVMVLKVSLVVLPQINIGTLLVLLQIKRGTLGILPQIIRRIYISTILVRMGSLLIIDLEVQR